jgi:hypothetical protein
MDEIIVLADCYHEGLKHPIVGNIELQNTRDEVLVFANAFAYVPVSMLIVGDDNSRDPDRWLVEDIVDTTYMVRVQNISYIYPCEHTHRHFCLLYATTFFFKCYLKI